MVDRARSAPPTPRVLSVNVGGTREVEWRGSIVRTGIWKSPVGDRPVSIRGANLDGDEQADHSVHGGPDKAVYAYAAEDYAYWREAEGIAVEPGLFGENLTVEGIDLAAAPVGERWRVGTALLEVSQPRLPCVKLGIRVGDSRFPRRFLAASRLGAYLRIVEAGVVRRGDVIEVESRPDHDVTLAVLAASLHDPALAARVRAIPGLSAGWLRLLRPAATGVALG